MASWYSAQFCRQNAKHPKVHGSGMPSDPQHGFKRGQHELQKGATAQAAPAAPDSTVSTKITCHHIATREANCHWKSPSAHKNQKSCSNLKPHTSCEPCMSAGQKKGKIQSRKINFLVEEMIQCSVPSQICPCLTFFKGQSPTNVGAEGEEGVYLPLNRFLPTQKTQPE